MFLFYTGTETTQFWTIILMVTVFGLDIIRRIVFEGKSIASKLREREEEKSERISSDYLANIERHRIAEEVKTTLLDQQAEVKQEFERQSQLVETARQDIAEEVKTTLLNQQAEVKQELKKQSQIVENALESKQFGFEKHLEKQFEIVETALHKNEITTKTDLNGETVKIKQAIDNGTETAKAAYKEANTINQKLARMSEAGLIKLDENKHDEVKKAEEQNPEK